MRRALYRSTVVVLGAACTAKVRVMRPASCLARTSFVAAHHATIRAFSTTCERLDAAHAIPEVDGAARGDQHGQQKHSDSEKPRSRRILDTLFSNWQKGLMTSVGACMGVGIVTFALWTPIQHDATERSAAMATDMLQDANIKKQATELSREVVNAILKDDQSVILLVDVIKRLLADKESRVSVSLFIQSVFEDRHTQEISKQFVIGLLRDDWVRGELHKIAYSLVVDLLQNQQTKDITSDFLLATAIDALKDNKLHLETAKAVRSSAYFAINPWASVPDAKKS